MQRKTEHIVRLRAGGLCEYCRLPQSPSFLTFPLDHVIAIQHGGKSTEANLAVACPECNLSKGPNIAGLDPRGGKLTRLFDPRRDEWTRHFRLVGAEIVGLTPIGRTTVYVLDMNEPDRLRLRAGLIAEGIFPIPRRRT